jgi:predicted RNA-binding protein with RPS1 domain
MVKVLEVDKQGKIRLSRKEAMQAEQTAQSQS